MAEIDNEIKRGSFGDHFHWGVATAAFQIEGSCGADGKGASIWDAFTAKKGTIRDGHHAQTSCDFYLNYEQDIALLKKLNIPNFRFSISWSRLMPAGETTINQAGIDFYNKLIDHCLSNDITPWITLYHWDLPLALEQRGGWTNRAIIDWFSDYVRLCATSFGDRVKHWMVMNEPMVFTGAGYFLGIHAPGKKGLKNFIPAVHHATLSISTGGRILRSIVPDAEIGTTFSCSPITPFSNKQKDLAAAARADALINRLFIEPILGLGYPMEEIALLRRLKKYFLPGDEELLPFDFDFIGLQNYTREVVKHSYFIPYLRAKIVEAAKRNVEITTMKWEVYPPAIYDILKQFSKYSQIKKIYITENGSAFPDQVTDGKVVDPKRLIYLKDHLAQVLKAKNEGVNIGGYFIWTLTDNFEWAEGYHPRFGIVHVNFETQERIIKSSGEWFANFLKT